MKIFSLVRALAGMAIVSSHSFPYMKLTPEEEKHLEGDPRATHIVTFDFQVFATETEYNDFGQLKFALFGDILPRTVAAFTSTASKKTDGYTGTIVHRVLNNILLECGKLKKVGYQQYETLPAKTFPQENFKVTHTKTGRISLHKFLASGENGAIFFVFIPKENSFVEEHCVSFGQLIGGFDVLTEINRLPKYDNLPIFEIVISQTRVYKVSWPMHTVVFYFFMNNLYIVLSIAGLFGLVLIVTHRRIKKLISLRVSV